ncbi:sulfurtransferase TusA family protein [Vulgatibacter incomptus]|uniref:Rhodanese-like domain protein n=1 Tax=Vulgatibacter incomptus TaxID=1391653 RepID=A0A0K1PC10_9BACT|nr:sulfurtransferase TusA family protein [Vulgatibacter incomptus]AKU91073.1 Rhodanese-like domain protein [Vulgatibacter incomptus]
MERLEAARTIDTSGSFCPVPIIETAKAAKELEDSQVLLVIATDPGISSDMPVWCKGTGHELLGTERDGRTWRCWVRIRKPGPERS